MRFKRLLLAAGILTLSAGAASAATVTNDLNLRSGPGTRYGVVATMPAGAYVNVLGCAGSWCRVDWRGRVGFASSSYIAGGGAVYAAAPVYVAPPPVFSFGFGIGSSWNHRHGHHHRGHWRHHHRRH